MKVTRFGLGLVIMLALDIAPSHANQLIYHNSFEVADGYPDPNGQIGTIGPGLAGSRVGVFDELAYFNPATDGTQYLAFGFGQGQSPPDGSFTTPDIQTVDRATYLLEFDYGNFGYPGALPQTIQVTVTDTVTSLPLLSQSITDATQVFTPVMSGYSFKFTGRGHPVRVKFSDATPAVNDDAADGLLDNVRVTLVVPGGSVNGMTVTNGAVSCLNRRTRETSVSKLANGTIEWNCGVKATAGDPIFMSVVIEGRAE